VIICSFFETYVLTAKAPLTFPLSGDTPFGGDIPGEKVFDHTDKIMAFDVGRYEVDDNSRIPSWTYGPPHDFNTVDKIRRVGLFEGKDEFGRLQPLLGGEKVTNIIDTLTWSEPITEKPALDDVEEWDIFNFSVDAHPIHLHLVGFYVMGRYPIDFDSNADADGLCGNNTDYDDLDGK
jgi:spore coat protein A, manganese oxidase